MEDMSKLLSGIRDLLKASEAGFTNAAPDTLTQGAALQREDLSSKMESVCAQDKQMFLQKLVTTESADGTTWQFIRELSHGQWGGSAQFEGHVGQEETSEYVRVVVPMSYYSHIRKVTLQATLVKTFDGKKADERAADSAAKKIAGDVEFDMMRGCDSFSSAGVFDGNPNVIPLLPNMHGMFLQITQSDSQRQTQDQMFREFGGDESIVASAGGTLTQGLIEDAHRRSVMNHGEADMFLVDPVVLSAYNKLSYGKERIILANSPQRQSGSDLDEQAVSGGMVKIKMSRFLSGKTGSNPVRAKSPGSPVSVAASGNASTTTAGVVTTFLAGEVYQYAVTAVNEAGESGKVFATAVTIAADGDENILTITHPSVGTWKYFNLYRSAPGGSTASVKFIGSVLTTGSTTTTFNDQNNRLPGFVTGLLLQTDTMEIREMAAFTRLKMAVSELAFPEAFYRFLCIAGLQPRKNGLVTNLTG